jgi:hypothetical protein
MTPTTSYSPTQLRSAPDIAGEPAAGGREGIVLHLSLGLDRFLAAAADAGLSPSEATRLAVERALVLSDAVALGVDSESARRRICSAAAMARPKLAIAAQEGDRVRCLIAARPVARAKTNSRLVVPLPERLLARTKGRVPASALDPDIVAEMVSWEIAATLAGRTMGEWALLVLGSET